MARLIQFPAADSIKLSLRIGNSERSVATFRAERFGSTKAQREVRLIRFGVFCRCCGIGHPVMKLTAQ
jgi:hypothetical protein